MSYGLAYLRRKALWCPVLITWGLLPMGSMIYLSGFGISHDCFSISVSLKFFIQSWGCCCWSFLNSLPSLRMVFLSGSVALTQRSAIWCLPREWAQSNLELEINNLGKEVEFYVVFHVQVVGPLNRLLSLWNKSTFPLCSFYLLQIPTSTHKESNIDNRRNNRRQLVDLTQ